MDISSMLQWWQEWQLHILVLSSLGTKCFLALFSTSRKTHIWPICRFSIWLSYLGGDALAIYALATLLNIQKKLQDSSVDRARHVLQVLWAPIMLMHLGGLPNISAYNIEDNELWKRHIATAGSQVAIAIYVFCKLWPSSADKRLLAAAILLFVAGIVKCFEKPLALKRASFNNLVSQLLSSKADKNKNKDDKDNEADDNYKHKSEIDLEGLQNKQEIDLEVYVQEAKAVFFQSVDDGSIEDKQRSQLSPLKLFVDMGYHNDKPPLTLESFVKLSKNDPSEGNQASKEVRKQLWETYRKEIRKKICAELSRTFDLLYTKDFTIDREGNEQLFDIMFSFCTWVLCLLLPIPAIGLLHSSPKEAYRGSDVKITFLLLYVTLFGDILALLLLNFFPKKKKVAQLNLIALFASKKHAWLTCIAELLGLKDFLERYYLFLTSSTHVEAEAITDSVCLHVIHGWKKYILDAEDYMKFSDIRGHWTLDLNKCAETLGWSLEMPFDESILHWHLATEFCFHYLPSRSSDSKNHADLARNISSYMMHLLFANPEMLMPGSRRNLCIDAYKGIHKIFKGQKPLVEKTEVVTQIFEKFESGKGQKGLIYTAWLLAQELKELGDDDKMWKVIRGVWVEMLCFSAGRCRGYLHAKSLGSGGEYLTFVSLLMAHAGMETYPKRQQRVQLRLSREARMDIVRIRMEEDKIEAVRKREERVHTGKENRRCRNGSWLCCASPEVEVVVAK